MGVAFNIVNAVLDPFLIFGWGRSAGARCCGSGDRLADLPAGVAAFGITVRSMSFTWLYCGAVSTAVATLAGQSLGRRDVDGIRILVTKSTRLSVLLSVGLGVLYWTFAREVVGIFEHETPLGARPRAETTR